MFWPFKPRHRHEWYLRWRMGNVWTFCRSCPEARMVPFGDASEIPAELIEAETP